ncbi:hypothetical protein [Saccharolobus islandicus]|uniref:Uncharacterized protein n=2 Tax=Saccharolobus islandicus TaxID=43080 RepID=C3MS20_SACI4|nr:hypothetical protein [Sulfolobus islandicus]ACP38963.1 conserved hypothetical protein [Sulfolobus islandicus M.14.25]ACP56168.1 conserved hypothetical protein [Sulfolobus islandicus M.16.27]
MRKAQSEYIGFIIAIIIIALVIIPLFYILSNYSVPSAKKLDYAQVLKNQINGGGILIFFNSTFPETSSALNSNLIVLKGSTNYTLAGVYYMKNGVIYNITSNVKPFVFSNGIVTILNKNLPQPLIYNFTLPAYVWNYSVILQINGYNVTVFAQVYPNETAFTS